MQKKEIDLERRKDDDALFTFCCFSIWQKLLFAIMIVAMLVGIFLTAYGAAVLFSGGVGC